MVGNIVNRGVAEPVFRAKLRRMGDAELASAARMWIWQREMALYPYDEDVWRCECIKQECEGREKPVIFQLTENNILAQLKKNGCCG
jgi:hypothetical protein